MLSPWHAPAARTFRLVLLASPTLAGRGVQFAALAGLAVVVTPRAYGEFIVLQALVLGAASVVGSTTGAALNAQAARASRAGAAPVVALVHLLLRPRRVVLFGNALLCALVVPAGAACLLGGALDLHVLLLLAVVGAASGTLPVGEAFVAVLAGSGRTASAAWTESARAVTASAAALAGGALAGPAWAAAGLVVPDVLLSSVLLVMAGVTRARNASIPAVSSPPEAPPREGLVAGIGANLLGQIAAWGVLWAVGAVSGPVGLGVYGVALRFASVVTVAPVILGKLVLGDLAAPSPGRDQWTPRSFLTVLTVLSVAASCASFAVLVVVFPALVDTYAGLVPVTLAVLAAACARAALVALGAVCVARRQWTTWVVADLVSLVVVLAGIAVVVVGHCGLVAVVVVSAIGNVAGVVVRGAAQRGYRPAPPRAPATKAPVAPPSGVDVPRPVLERHRS